MMKECPLCSEKASFFFKEIQSYYKCPQCDGIFVSEDDLPNEDSEKERYQMHDDDTNDKGYRKFVSPITSLIQNDFSPSNVGLDFGAGTSAIISVVLGESDYNISNYDPYFHKKPELLNKQYDYISSCEVIEHFYKPYKEFKLLKSMLKKSGKIYLMTEPYDSSIDFSTWYYKNDPTHVFLYSAKTFEWIKNTFDFKEVEVKGRLIVFTN